MHPSSHRRLLRGHCIRIVSLALALAGVKLPAQDRRELAIANLNDGPALSPPGPVEIYFPPIPPPLEAAAMRAPAATRIPAEAAAMLASVAGEFSIPSSRCS